MTSLHSVLSGIVLLSLLLATSAKVEHNHIRNDDRDVIQLSQSFGFAGSLDIDAESKDSNELCSSTNIAGYLNLTLSRVDVLAPISKRSVPTNFSRMGFVLVPSQDGTSLEEIRAGVVCNVWLRDPAKLGKTLVTFADPNIKGLLLNKSADNPSRKQWQVLKSSWHVKVCNGGVRALYFLNCENRKAVSFEAVITTYNVVDDKNTKSFVSVGETELDEMYWAMFAMFAAATCAWAYLLYKERESVHTVHYLMLLLAVFRTLTLMCQAFENHYLEVYGRPDGWNIAFYVFTFFRGVMFFTVVVLIGTGWSYMKPFLGDKEKRILMVVVPLQIFANIAIIVTAEESPSVRDWLTWRDAFHLVDIICCCAVLFPIVWSIKHLREAAKSDGKAARNLEKLTLFRQFYVMVVVYIYFTRIVVYLLKSTLTDFAWVSDAAEQMATLAFYLWTGYKFKPHKENPYLKLNEEELDA